MSKKISESYRERIRRKAAKSAVEELTLMDVDYSRMALLAFRGPAALTICLTNEKYRRLILASEATRKRFIDHAIASDDDELRPLLLGTTLFKDFPNDKQRLESLLDSIAFNKAHTMLFNRR